jgi:H+/Cl- antiporter ClcA
MLECKQRCDGAVQMAIEKWNTVATVGLYLVENLMFASVACMLVIYFAPAAAGSGIPELMTYFNNAYIDPGYLSFHTFVAKV